jgi:hypothetical protein
MSKELWLTFDNNKETLQLPVNPPELSVGQGSQNDSIDVFNLGEVTILQKPKAMTFGFESFFPSMPGPYLNISEDRLKVPAYYVEVINKWRASYKPVRFIVTETEINSLCSIEDFSYSERAGDVGTLYYSLSLKEYKVITPRVMKNINGILVYDTKPSRPGAI